MSKAKDVRDAIDECEQDHWQCATCSSPAEIDGKYCRSCRMYWDDVSSGLFDRDENWALADWSFAYGAKAMSETKWTKGPWLVEEGRTVVWSTNCYDEGSGNVGCIVARAAKPSSWRSCRPTVDEQVANAHLIASAPEMAEALEPFSRALDDFRSYLTDEEWASINPETHLVGNGLSVADLLRARSAIAKAKGETQ